jgi:hypothetical protein
MAGVSLVTWRKGREVSGSLGAETRMRETETETKTATERMAGAGKASEPDHCLKSIGEPLG